MENPRPKAATDKGEMLRKASADMLIESEHNKQQAGEI